MLFWKKVGRLGWVAENGWAITPEMGASRIVDGFKFRVRQSGTTNVKFTKTLKEAKVFAEDPSPAEGVKNLIERVQKLTR